MRIAQELAAISVKLEKRRVSLKIATQKRRADELFALKHLLIKHDARTAAFETVGVESRNCARWARL